MNIAILTSLIHVRKFKRKHALKTTSPRFIAPGESFAVEFVVLKHFARRVLCGLDVVVYIKCVFCKLVLAASPIRGTYDTEKKPPKWGEFITTPRLWQTE